jgi:hypothetical protein
MGLESWRMEDDLGKLWKFSNPFHLCIYYIYINIVKTPLQKKPWIHGLLGDGKTYLGPWNRGVMGSLIIGGWDRSTNIRIYYVNVHTYAYIYIIYI